MPLRAVAGLIAAFITAEASAFVSLSTTTAGIVGGSGKSLNVPTTSVHMMGKRGGAKKKRNRLVEEEEVGPEIDSAGGAAAEEEDGNVPRLVVMDLDYTLW